MGKGGIAKYLLALLAIIAVFIAGGYFAYGFGRTLKNAGQTSSTMENSTAPTSSTSTTIGSSHIPSTTTTLPTTIPYNATITTRTTTIYYSSACYANSRFECGYGDYVLGNLTIEIVQNTGINWTDAYVEFVSNGTSATNGIPNVSFMAPNAVHVKYMYNGYGYDVTVPISSPNTTPGTAAYGSIWAKYNYSGSIHYADMGTVYLNASYPPIRPTISPTSATSSSPSSTSTITSTIV
ncbi:MAG: hypothetical protein KGI06_01855 [Candidatus Micrarchaeota archaeon]|nr:hypothetical protein [Candidatus Micrarchaeota archaeon]